MNRPFPLASRDRRREKSPCPTPRFVLTRIPPTCKLWNPAAAPSCWSARRISRRSRRDLVRQVIHREQPDCVVRGAGRAALRGAVGGHPGGEDLDLKEIIRKRQLSPLLANLILSSYQKRLGGAAGGDAGNRAAGGDQGGGRAGRPRGAVADRAVRVTMLRAWRSTSFVRKFWLLSMLISSMFDTTRVSEEDLRDIRKTDVLSELLQELGAMFPALHKVLIDERDLYLAEKKCAAATATAWSGWSAPRT